MVWGTGQQAAGEINEMRKRGGDHPARLPAPPCLWQGRADCPCWVREGHTAPSWQCGGRRGVPQLRATLGMAYVSTQEMSAIVQWLAHSLMCFLGTRMRIGHFQSFLGTRMRIGHFQSCGPCWVFQIC